MTAEEYLKDRTIGSNKNTLDRVIELLNWKDNSKEGQLEKYKRQIELFADTKLNFELIQN